MTRFTRLLVCAVAAGALAGVARGQTPAGTEWTYQGELRSAGQPASGGADLRFRLYDAASGGTQIGAQVDRLSTPLAQGRFTTEVDFGAGAFGGEARWLEIDVRTPAGAGAYTTLAPRQRVTGAPGAQYAAEAGHAGTATTAGSAGSAATAVNALNVGGQPASNVALLSGNQTFTGQVNFTNPGNAFAGAFSGAFAGDGSGLTALHGGNIAAGTVTRDRVAADIESVLGQWAPQLSTVISIDAVAWGHNAQGQTNVPLLPPGMTYTALAGGIYHSLGLRSDGKVLGWGSNNSGQIAVPALPAGMTYTGVGGGNFHSLALRSDGNLVAWGSNQFGQVTVPVLPAGLIYTAAASGGDHNLAVRSDGNAVAWGWNNHGQTNVPALPVGVTYTAVAGGGLHSLALRSDGNVVAWGLNSAGQTSVPALPAGVTYTAVSGGGGHSLALRSDGNVVAWGSISQVPALPSGVTYTAVAAGTRHNLALRSDGNVAAWGSNDLGQTNVPPLPAGMFYSGVAAGNSCLHSLALRGPMGEPSLASTVGISIGGEPLPPEVGLTVAGGTIVSGQVSAFSFAGSGAGLTGLNAASLTGAVPSSSLVGVSGAGLINLPAANLTGLVPAASLSGVSGAGLTDLTATSIVGTIPDSNLSTNVPRLGSINAFGSANSFAGQVGVGTTSPHANFRLVVEQPVAGTWSGGIAAGSNTNAKVVLGELQGVATIGGHNAALNAWATLAINSGPGAVGIGTIAPSQKLTVAGNANVTGTLSKGGGSFQIDHPLDPENRYLYHSFVESPDMMNIYNGNVVTDERGYATVTLPEYFEALNRDFRYQLTVIDESEIDFVLAKVYRPIRENQFTIRTNLAHIQVSWQVTGVRRDAWAEANRIPNAVEKPAEHKGRYLHPEAFGEPAEKGIYAGTQEPQ